MYDPDRLQYPLRRKEGTERGAGEWERVSWDEAISDIASKMKEVQEKYGNQALEFSTLSGNLAYAFMQSHARLANILNAGQLMGFCDMASAYGMMRMCGPKTNNWDANELTDMVNSKNIIAWASNETEGQIQAWHFIKEAKQLGAKLIVIDPTFTQLASKADLWVPLRTGTDMPLAMGLMNIILANGKMDEDFMRNHTVAPFLVRRDTKKFLRGEDGKGSAGDYMVLENGKPLLLSEAGMPDFEGTVDVNGIECDTAFTLLRSEIDKFTPDVVSDMTQVPVETLQQLADCCCDGPVYHYVGYGAQAYMNGVHTTHAGLTLCAMTGNLGKHGASYGALWRSTVGDNTANYNAPTGPTETETVPLWNLIDVCKTGTFNGSPFDVRMLYIYGTNILNIAPDTNAWLKEVWPKMEMIVVADTMMTDTACYADYVLPVAHWFEVEDITYGGAAFTMSYNEKAVDPPFECKPDTDIVRMLADELSIGEYFQDSDSEILRQCLDSDDLRELDITYDGLKNDLEARFEADEVYVAFKDGNFSTPSGRLEFYLEDPQPRTGSTAIITDELTDRERLPRWFPPNEAWYENDIAKKYPLQVMSERPRWRVHSQWYTTKALRELDPEPIVKVNPTDAKKRGIEMDDYVECYNDRGHAIAKAVLSEAVRPGTLVYPKGWHIYQHKAGGWSELLNYAVDPFAVNPNFMDAQCEIRVWNEKTEGSDK